MEIVVVERTYAEALPAEVLLAAIEAHGADPCAGLRRVRHLRSMLSRDGLRLLCFYEAPDAATVREASALEGAEHMEVWTARVFEGVVAEPSG